MTEFTADAVAHAPTLTSKQEEPKGVLQKHLKVFVYLGAALLVIVAAMFSSTGKKVSTGQTKGQHPQPIVQDNTDNNVADLKNQLDAERQKEQQQAAMSSLAAAQQTGIGAPSMPQAVSGYVPAAAPVGCIPGQPCLQQPPTLEQQNGSGQLSPLAQQDQQLEARERERVFESRFSSNLVYAHEAASASSAAEQPGQQAGLTTLVPPRAAGQSTIPDKRSAEINIDSAGGQPYVVFEGTTVDAVLMNRLDGDAVGPVKVLVSNPLYSHDHQHVLIPEGSIVLGEARKIGSTGFGQQRRMAIVFHRMIMPDGYSVDLDQFQGLDQIGEEGVRDKVNDHYLRIFGTSIALGIISGAGEITQGGGTITTSGSQAFTSGASASVSQAATTVLDRFIQIPPTITIREGHRIKVYITQDMLLPAYTNHTIPQTF